MGKIKMSKTVPAETNHLRGDRESPGDGKNKIRVKFSDAKNKNKESFLLA